MPSATYELIRAAIRREQQVTCLYNDRYRELCPHVIGHSDGAEKLLAWQFAGETASTLPARGEWRCLNVAEMRDVKTREGRWHTGSHHRTTQKCVQDVDVDVNVHVRKP